MTSESKAIAVAELRRNKERIMSAYAELALLDRNAKQEEGQAQ